MNYDYKEYTERHRPHIHPPNATLFVTFRLADSIPVATVRRYQAEKEWWRVEQERVHQMRTTDDSPELLDHQARLTQFHREWFKEFERILDKAECGPVWLKDERVASIIADALHWRDGKHYRLDAYCIMSNHVHVVFTPKLSEKSLRVKDGYKLLRFLSEDPPLDVIMHSLKSWTANQANAVLGRRGQFWQHESYDHVVRDPEEFDRVVHYVLYNPVKAGLVREWQDWRWSWIRG